MLTYALMQFTMPWQYSPSGIARFDRFGQTLENTIDIWDVRKQSVIIDIHLYKKLISSNRLTHIDSMEWTANKISVLICSRYFPGNDIVRQYFIWYHRADNYCTIALDWNVEKSIFGRRRHEVKKSGEIFGLFPISVSEFHLRWTLSLNYSRCHPTQRIHYLTTSTCGLIS